MTLREMVLESAEKEGFAIGLVRGIAQSKAEIIESLLSMPRFTITEVAQMTCVTEDFVLKVKKAIE